MGIERRNRYVSRLDAQTVMPTGSELVIGIQKQFETVIKPQMDKNERDRRRARDLDRRFYPRP